MASIQSRTDTRLAQPESSLRDRLAGYLASAVDWTRTDAQRQAYPDLSKNVAKELMPIVENVPVLGQGLAAEDLGQAVKDKSWLGAGLAVLGMMPGGGAEKKAAEGVIDAAQAVEAGRNALTEIKSGVRAGRGTEGIKSDLPLSGGRISQRFPTAKGATEDPLTENLLINTNVLKQNPAALERASQLIKSHPGATREMQEMTPEQAVDAFRDHATQNLLYMHDLMPPGERARAARWYHGANRIANERANEVGVHPHAAAGSYAGLSPQMDWFKNVYFGDSVLRTLAKDPKVDPEMLRVAREDPRLGRFREEGARTIGGQEHGSMQDFLRSLEGRNISNMSPEEQAIAIRLYDETYGPRQYSKISPEGDYGDIMLSPKGRQPMGPGWGSFTDIEKAVRSATETGGDASKISPLMGDKHKVRNFYNDIVNPNLAETFGDITSDTHQIAAAHMLPLSSSSPIVSAGLGGSPALGSGVSGLQGLYPIYADATRNAAAQRDMPVIAMQSIPWEGIRSLFPKEFKDAKGKNLGIVEDIWRAYGRGEITADQARGNVVRAAGGFRPPSW